MVTLAPGAIVPTSQVMLAGTVVQLPRLVVKEETGKLSERESVMTTLVAVAGPLFETVTV